MLRLNGTSVFSQVRLVEDQKVPKRVQILRVGKFKHPDYGDFEITPQVLSEMIKNFKDRVRGVDVAFDYFHEADKEASGWINELELQENGQELWGVVDWTPKAAQKIADRELRYVSPDFAFEWEDPESGKTFSNVLFGAGLTNRPFVKEMNAIVANEKEGEYMTELEKVQKKLSEAEADKKKLADDCAAKDKQMADMVPKPAAGEESDEVKGLKAQLAELQAKLAKAQGDQEAALAEKKKAEEAQKLAEKEKDFNSLLSEGKACAAQKDAFIKGDMAAFIKLAQPVNLKAKGSSETSEEGEVDSKEVLKLAEEKQKTNPKLSRGDAVSQAVKELKKK